MHPPKYPSAPPPPPPPRVCVCLAPIFTPPPPLKSFFKHIPFIAKQSFSDSKNDFSFSKKFLHHLLFDEVRICLLRGIVD